MNIVQRMWATNIAVWGNAYVHGMLEAHETRTKWHAFFGEAKLVFVALGVVSVVALVSVCLSNHDDRRRSR